MRENIFRDNLIALRKKKKLSQEDLAEQLGISRQTLSKYETGESIPDINRCKSIADFFDVTVDNLISCEGVDSVLGIPPKGKHAFGVITVGKNGQIRIPDRARTVFHIKPGDNLVALGDEASGIVLIKEDTLKDFIDRALKERQPMEDWL